MEDALVISRTISIGVRSPSEITNREFALIDRAVEVRRNAQAPHSNYWVGAAVLSENFNIYAGCNVENANYTGTIHAEGSAIAQMIAKEGAGTKILMIAVVGGPEGHEVIWGEEENPRPKNLKIEDFCPACGHCLCTILENCLGDRETPMLLLTRWGEVARTTIGDAYPMSFGPENLGVDVRRKVRE